MKNIINAGPATNTARITYITYHIERILPKSVFHKNYPENPQTFGEYLRKARIDAGLLIKDLAGKIGVTEDTVINWEVRGRMPRGRSREALGRVFGEIEQRSEHKR